MELDDALMNVSVLLLTYNEEINLPRCLAALRDFDDIVVVDSGSTDQTVAISQAAGARILTRPFDDFARQRNFGLDHGEMKHEWVLHLDADEVLTDAFRQKLEALRPPDTLDGYRVPSKTMLHESWLKRSGTYPTYQVRLGHRDRLRFIQVGHGQREASPPERISTFDEPYLHYNFSHGLKPWLAKHLRYAGDEAKLLVENRNKPAKANILSGDATERRRALKYLSNQLPLWTRPFLRFTFIYIFRLGFLDGGKGLLYAFMMFTYECMIVILGYEALSQRPKR